MIPSETREDVENELDELLTRLSADDPALQAGWRMSMVRPAWQAQEGPLFTALESACTARLGQTPARATGLMWTDAALMQQAGIPSVVVGPKGEGKHGLVEWVDVSSVVSLAQILVDTALQFCGPTL
jgi:acetylornithine deacetylase